MDKVKNATVASRKNGLEIVYTVDWSSGLSVRAVFIRKGEKYVETNTNGHWEKATGWNCDSIADIAKSFLAGETVSTPVKRLNSAQQAQALADIPAIVLKRAADEKMGAFMLDTLQGESKSVDAAKLARAYMHEGDTVSAYEQVEGDPMALALLVQALDRDDQNLLISYIDCMA